MKFALAFAAVVAVASAQYAGFGNNSPGRYNAPRPVAPKLPARPISQPARPLSQPPRPSAPAPSRVSSNDQNANVLRYDNDIGPDGSYSYTLQIDNGISAQAQGTPRDFGGNPPVVPVVAQGAYSWTSPEGQPITITWVADENGFQPTGDAIPTPHPIPEAILKSLQYISKKNSSLGNHRKNKMKFAVVILGLVAAVSAQFNNNGQYSPFNYNRNRYQYSTPSPFRYTPSVTIAPTPFFASTPSPIPAVQVARIVSNDHNAETLKFGNDNAPDGSYNYFYETSNGIAAQEQGVPRVFGGNPPVAPVVAQGSYSYTSPEGVPVAISYVADENGYQPSGNVLPTSPPLPPQIARALEYIARSAPRK
ncbi:uncharacterized protein LOC142973254 [Anticarsia gemmatalis]|uniref:uncharacterized protein LOC142973254 n=1 Tax=Anticarsia gemmatalis TaxID=129554 RepID=UPI003F775188